MRANDLELQRSFVVLLHLINWRGLTHRRARRFPGMSGAWLWVDKAKRTFGS